MKHHRDPRFFIVGTPRSGTTLLQRLCNEIDGVAVPPETHFSRLLPSVVADLGYSWPLQPDEARQALHRYQQAEALFDLAFNVDRVVSSFGGANAYLEDVFRALLRELVPDARIVGEKTPHHLRVMSRLATAFPEADFIAVVRDPRAVAVSRRGVPWASSGHRTTATQWLRDTWYIDAAIRSLGHRVLVLRYEDVVRDPDSVRELLAARFGSHVAKDAQAGPMYSSKEWWKSNARGDISTNRIDSWRHELERGDIERIEAICGPEMERHGYDCVEHPPGLGVDRRTRYRLRAKHAVAVGTDRLVGRRRGWAPRRGARRSPARRRAGL